MRPLLLSLLGLFVLGSAVSAQEVASPTPAALNGLCQDAFRHASTVYTIPSHEPGSTDVSAAPVDPAYLDYVVQRCTSFEEWSAGALSHPHVLRGADPLAFLELRCNDPASGLARYAACVSLVQALATPVPTAVPTAAPNAAPIASSAPTVEALSDTPPAKTGGAPRRGARPVGVPDGRIPVQGADSVRYFRIRGATHEQLTRHLRAQTRRFCGRVEPIACVRPREWQFTVRTSVEADAASCRIAGVDVATSYLAHVPRWVAPSRVQAPLAWWWRQVARRIAWEQAHNARILHEHVAALSDAVVGLHCSSFDAALQAWNRQLDAALAAFEQREAPRREQAFQAWLREAFGT